MLLSHSESSNGHNLALDLNGLDSKTQPIQLGVIFGYNFYFLLFLWVLVLSLGLFLFIFLASLSLNIDEDLVRIAREG